MKYAPLWGILSLTVFLFAYVTLPSLEMNRYLNDVRGKRIQEIESLREAGHRMQHMAEALQQDPITIERLLRQRFSGTLRKGEVEIDTLSQ